MRGALGGRETSEDYDHPSYEERGDSREEKVTFCASEEKGSQKEKEDRGVRRALLRWEKGREVHTMGRLYSILVKKGLTLQLEGERELNNQQRKEGASNPYDFARRKEIGSRRTSMSSLWPSKGGGNGSLEGKSRKVGRKECSNFLFRPKRKRSLMGSFPLERKKNKKEKGRSSEGKKKRSLSYPDLENRNRLHPAFKGGEKR